MDIKKQYLDFLVKKIDILYEIKSIDDEKIVNFSKIIKILNESVSCGVSNLLDDTLNYYSENYEKNNEIIIDLIKIGGNPEINNGSLINKAIVFSDIQFLTEITKNNYINLSQYIETSERIMKKNETENNNRLSLINEIEKKRKLQNVSKVLYLNLIKGDFNTFEEHYTYNKININLHANNEQLFREAKELNKRKFIDFLVKEGAGHRNDFYYNNPKDPLKFHNILKKYNDNYKVINIVDKNLPKDLNDLIKNTKDSGILYTKIEKLFNLYKKDIKKEREILNNAFNFAFENKFEGAIDLFLNENIFPEKYQKEIFINALKEKNTNRFLKIWNPIENPLDLTFYLDLKIKDKKIIGEKNLLNIIMPTSYNSGLLKEQQFNNIFLYSCKKAKENDKINITFSWCNTFVPIVTDTKSLFIKMIKEDIEEKKIEFEKEIKEEPIVLNNKNKLSEKEIVKEDILNDKNKLSEEETIKKSVIFKNEIINKIKSPLPTIKTLKGEIVTRKEIQKRWDIFIINDFFAEGKDRKIMLENVNFFMKKNGLNKNLLIANNFNIYRMPIEENKYQLEKFSRQFICSYVPKLAEILFNENSETIKLNEGVILKKIIFEKIRTENNSKNKTTLKEEEIKERKLITEKFKNMGKHMALQSIFKEETSKHNWNTCK